MKTFIILIFAGFFLVNIAVPVMATPIATYEATAEMNFKINLYTGPEQDPPLTDYREPFNTAVVENYENGIDYGSILDTAWLGESSGSANITDPTMNPNAGFWQNEVTGQLTATTTGTASGPEGYNISYYETEVRIDLRNASDSHLDNTRFHVEVSGFLNYMTTIVNQDNNINTTTVAWSQAWMECYRCGHQGDAGLSYRQYWGTEMLANPGPDGGLFELDPDLSVYMSIQEHGDPPYDVSQIRFGISVQGQAQVGSPDLSQAPNPIPEPATLALMAIGIVGLVGAGYRRRKKAKQANIS